MLRKTFVQTTFSALLFMILCTSCSADVPQVSPSQEPQATAAAASSDTPMPAVVLPSTDTPSPATPAPTSTETALPTDTATVTSTLLPSDTPTPEASPTPDQVLPGLYGAGGCDNGIVGWGVKYELCVISVTVTRERHMIFTMSWTLTNIPPSVTVTKESDKNNKKMYIIDNLGNRYDHISGGGEAYATPVMKEGVSVMGTFEFSAPPTGAFSFDFHDDNRNLTISNISLTERIILFGDLELVNTPYTLPYLLEYWDLVSAEGGEAVLTHKVMPACTLVERPFGIPQGKLKNHIQIGTLTYDIYGYIDQANNLGVREYVLVEGLEGLDPENLPFLVVSIPLDNSEACIYAVSDLLAGVYGEEQ
jgi:hypothetical protein